MKTPSILIGLCLLTTMPALAQNSTPKKTTGTPIPIVNSDEVASHVDLGDTPQATNILRHYDALEQTGDALLATSNYVGAEATFRQAIASGFPAPTTALRGLAEALAGQGKTNEAIEVYRRLVYRISSSTSAEVRVLMKYALLLDQTGQWNEAVQVYNKALPRVPGGELPKIDIQFDPSNPQPQAMQSAAHIALGLDNTFHGYPDHTKALQEYQKALQLEPNWDLANFYSGYGLQQLGRTEESQKAYRKAVTIGQGKVKWAAEQALNK